MVDADKVTNRNESNLLRFLVLQNKSTILIFWKKVYESNPRYKSLRFGFTNPDLRVRQPGFVRIWDSQNCIFKDSLCAIVLRIRQDSLDSWKQVESFENWLDSWSRFETNLLKSGLVIHDTIRIFLSPDSWPTNRYESMDSQNESMFLQISYTNPASLII